MIPRRECQLENFGQLLTVHNHSHQRHWPTSVAHPPLLRSGDSKPGSQACFKHCQTIELPSFLVQLQLAVMEDGNEPIERVQIVETFEPSEMVRIVLHPLLVARQLWFVKLDNS